MKIIQRVGYYLGGFSIGLIVLAFFLRGKNTSCDYGPNARTVKNIGLKKKAFSQAALNTMAQHNLDTLAVHNLILKSDVDFSNSETHNDSCNRYILESKHDGKSVQLVIKNCDSLATITTIDFLK